MMKVLWFAALMAALGVILLLSSTASAHPGVEGTVMECHEDDGEDNASFTLDCHEEEEDEESSHAAVL